MARRFHPAIICALGVFLFLLIPCSLLAADIYVATTGSDSAGTGAIGAPYLTINKAESVVACGDTIYIRGGTYAGTNNIGSDYGDGRARCSAYSSAVTIRNYPGEHVIVQPGGALISVAGWGSGALYPSHASFYWKVIASSQNAITFDCLHCQWHNNVTVSGNNADYIWLENIEIINSYSSGIYPGGSDYWTLINLNIHDNGTIGVIPQAHGLYWDGKGLLVDGGLYHDNVGFGIHQFHSGASDRDDNVIRNVKVYNNNLFNELGGGVILSTGHRNLIYNSIIYNNTGSGLDINYRCEACAAYNNTIYGNSVAGIGIGNGGGGGAATNSILKNNLLNSNGAAINDGGSGTVIANNYTGGNPGLTNAAIGDFTLQLLSSAIGGGINLSSIFATDFAGKPRAVGKSTFDIGAFEYTPASSDTIPPVVSISVITP